MHRYAYASRGRRMYAYACICVRMHEHARMETDALPCIHTHAYVMHARSCTQGHGCIDMHLCPYAGVCMPMQPMHHMPAYARTCTHGNECIDMHMPYPALSCPALPLQMPNARCSKPDAQCQFQMAMLSARCPMPMPNDVCSMPDAQCLTPNANP